MSIFRAFNDFDACRLERGDTLARNERIRVTHRDERWYEHPLEFDPGRWTAEVRIDAKPIKGERPTEYFPWGVHINRQRLAGNTPEYYMLCPSGTNFKDMKCMGNLIIRK